MKFIRKSAEYIGYTLYHGEKFNEWRCPNKKCGMSVLEEYVCCPYCGQKLRFNEPFQEEIQQYKVLVQRK